MSMIDDFLLITKPLCDLLDWIIDFFDEFWIPILISLMIVVCLFLAVALLAVDQEKWNNFKIKHHCEITEKHYSTVGWKCDDGITYYR